jgi:hypothetical protein
MGRGLGVLGAVGGAALGLAIGFALGERQGFIRGLRALEQSVAGTLARDVEVASSIRIGDAKRALTLLDLAVDGAVLNLSAAQTRLGILVVQPDALPEEALQRAKLYRSIVPPTGVDAPKVVSSLVAISLERSRPTPALERLRASEGAAQQ